MEVDRKDMEILGILHEDSSLSTREIAKKLNMPITTVHNRIKKMRESGVIKRFTVDIDYKKIGKTIYAFILVSVDYPHLKRAKKSQQDLADYFLKYPFVRTARIVTGGIDMVLTVRADDIKDLNKIIATIQGAPGVNKTETLMVLNDY